MSAVILVTLPEKIDIERTHKDAEERGSAENLSYSGTMHGGREREFLLLELFFRRL